MSVKDLISKLSGGSNADAETQATIEALNTREAELATKETELNSREAELNTREADLAEALSEATAQSEANTTKFDELATKEAALVSKEAELATKETELNTRAESLDQEVALAAQKLSVQGVAPVAPEAKDPAAEIVAAYNAETDKGKRAALFQKHEAILRAHVK
jgi:chromosome segregation ATPase